MLKIAICDDEKAIVAQIKELVEAISERENLPLQAAGYFDGETLLNDISTGQRFDLLYMDIQMPDADGIATVKNIRMLDEDMLIIFVSSYESYCRQLFRLDVFSFIKKPIENDEFARLLCDAAAVIQEKNRPYIFKYKHNEYKIAFKEIVYFESVGRKIKIHLRDGSSEQCNAKLSTIEDELTAACVPFLRIHQSYLVNFRLVKARSKTSIAMIDGSKLPISADRLEAFNKQYGKLLGEEASV
jgi:DNA-binding LytR/AlgR family response regulator